MKKMLIALFAITSLVSASLVAGDCGGCKGSVCKRTFVITKPAKVENEIIEQYVCPQDCATPGAMVGEQRVVQG